MQGQCHGSSDFIISMMQRPPLTELGAEIDRLKAVWLTITQL
jgi:hypothetical protein